MEMLPITLYIRPECELCEEARDALRAALADSPLPPPFERWTSSRIRCCINDYSRIFQRLSTAASFLHTPQVGCAFSRFSQI